MPRQTTASTTICPTNNRRRSDQTRRALANDRDSLLAGWLEDIPCAAQRVDHGLATTVDLLAQVGNIEFDDVGPAAEVVAPDAVQNLCLAQDSLGVAHHEAQQLKLGGGQRDWLTSARHF